MEQQPHAPRAPWSTQHAASVIHGHASQDGALLPILHALQGVFGYIHPEATDLIAEALNISRAEVHGVISFYHDFRTEPPPRLIVKICRAEACQAAGGREAANALLQKLGLDWSEPAADQSIVIEPVYCLGLCAASPAAMIGETLVAGFDGAELSACVQAAR